MMIPGNVKKIAVLRALQLGDMMCAIPAIRALKNAYPHAEITLLGLPWVAQFVNRFNQYFSSFIHFPGYPGLPEQEYSEPAFMHFLQQVRAEQFDLVLQMQGNGTVINDILPLFKAANLAGFYTGESYKPAGYFIRYPNQSSEVHRHLKLMRHLGVQACGDHLEFPLAESDYKEFEKLCLYLPPQKYVCIHPGSRARWRQWPPKYFAALGDICVEAGLIVVITGTTEEKDITSEVVKCMHHRVIDLTGLTSLGATAILLQNAFMLIANCTGVSHIASATKTRSIIISMDGEPQRWAPLDTALHTVIDCRDNPRFNDVLACTLFLLTEGRVEARA